MRPMKQVKFVLAFSVFAGIGQVAIDLLSVSFAAFAQTDRGTNTGTVTDPAGAVIPNAMVQAKMKLPARCIKPPIPAPATTRCLNYR
jgi:hypothetical protein